MAEKLATWEESTDTYYMHTFGSEIVDETVASLADPGVYRQTFQHLRLQTSIPHTIKIHRLPLSSYCSEVTYHILNDLACKYTDFQAWLERNWFYGNRERFDRTIVDATVEQYVNSHPYYNPLWQNTYGKYATCGVLDLSNMHVNQLTIGLRMNTLTLYAEARIDPRNLRQYLLH